MRVGVDARELVGHGTGVGRYLAELLARWTRASWASGDDLVLFTPEPVRSLLPWLGDAGARTTLVTVEGTGGTRWEQHALAGAARRAGLDVFFAPGYTAPMTLRVPVVVAMHDVSFAAHPEWFRRREGFRQRILARLTARRAVTVVTLTRFSRDEIVRCLGVPAARVEIVSPAVDTHPALRPTGGQSPTRVTGGAPTILYVGSIFARRHVPELIAAFARVAQTHAGVRLVLVGADRSWPPQRVADAVAGSGAAARIDWHTWLDEGSLRREYQRARVFAFLSEYEGFGLTPLEALAAGVPPLVADVPGAREAYGSAAVYVDPSDEAAIVGALHALLDDSRLRGRVLDAAAGVLARYSWDDSAARTYELLRRAAARRR